MNKKRDKDEYLEQLWSMKEKNIDAIEEMKKGLHVEFSAETLQELIDDNMVETDNTKHTIILTEKGEKEARRIIRAHRLAERLISDVLGEEFEAGAGEFEHTINPELVNGICTLLGHPRECPHGKPIPEGECCRRCDRTAQASVIPLTDLDVGQSAKVVYVQCKNDQQMHRMDGLQIRPGTTVKLHQKYPTIVIECEGASIALDNDVASNIRVWAKDLNDASETVGKKSFGGFGFRHRRGRGRG